jgi:putative FmdB family regulatory protein
VPTYEYRCDACGHGFELVQKITEESVKTCPKCGSAVRRVITGSGLIFKGSGFYKNDYKGSCRAEQGKTAPPACGGGCSGCG